MPSREAIQEEPQSEGLVYDSHTNILFVAFETIGLYQIQIRPSLPAEVLVTRDALIEPVTTFGRAFLAMPDEDEFECEYEAEPTADPAVEAPDSPVNAGAFLAADLEHYAPVPLGLQFALGLLVVQNGGAPEPADTSPINGYAFDGATQFGYVSFLDVLRSLR